MSTKSIERGTGPVLRLVLLVLYVAGTSQLDLLHSIVHHHGVAFTHQEKEENVPSQRLNCHNDTGQGCEHDAHLVVSDKCHMCDLAFQGDQTILSDVDVATGELSSVQPDFYISSPLNYRAVISSSRAPPALV